MRRNNGQQAPPVKLQPASDEQRVRRNNSQQAPPAKLQLTSDKLRIRRRNGQQAPPAKLQLASDEQTARRQNSQQLQLASDELRARHKKSSTCRHHFQVQPLRQRQTVSTGLQHHSFGRRCRKAMLGVCGRDRHSGIGLHNHNRRCSTLRASLSGTFLQRKDVVNQCLEFGAAPVPADRDISRRSSIHGHS